MFFLIENDLANERNTIVFKLNAVCTKQDGRVKNSTGTSLFLHVKKSIFHILNESSGYIKVLRIFSVDW